MQASRESEQHLAPAGSAPARIALFGVGALGDDAVAFTPAHQPAHAGCPADPGDEAHQIIVRVADPGTAGSGADEARLE